jgi:hypothetical protein
VSSHGQPQSGIQQVGWNAGREQQPEPYAQSACAQKSRTPIVHAAVVTVSTGNKELAFISARWYRQLQCWFDSVAFLHAGRFALSRERLACQDLGV